ncbi:MAG: RNA polymerase sigma factor [Oscillospiraceae bacterium]
MVSYLMLLESDNDRERFQYIYHNYRHRLYRVAKSILQSEDLAQDAVQDTFFKVIYHFEKIRALPCRELEPYIVTIVENTALSILKKERHTEELDENWDIADLSALPEDEAAYIHIVELILSMPDTYRETLTMKFVWEWSESQIAKELNLKLSTVSVRIHRGRVLLMNLLRKEGYHHDEL